VGSKWQSFRATLPRRHGRRRRIFQAFALLSNVYSIVTKVRPVMMDRWQRCDGGGGGCTVFVFSDKLDLYGTHSACYKVCVSHPFEIFSGYGRCMSNEFCGLLSLCPFYLPNYQSRPFFLFTAERYFAATVTEVFCLSYELYLLKEQCEEKLYEQNIKYAEDTNFLSFSLCLSIPVLAVNEFRLLNVILDWFWILRSVTLQH
jgi:hypothetical protein